MNENIELQYFNCLHTVERFTDDNVIYYYDVIMTTKDYENFIPFTVSLEESIFIDLYNLDFTFFGVEEEEIKSIFSILKNNILFDIVKKTGWIGDMNNEPTIEKIHINIKDGIDAVADVYFHDGQIIQFNAKTGIFLFLLAETNTVLLTVSQDFFNFSKISFNDFYKMVIKQTTEVPLIIDVSSVYYDKFDELYNKLIEHEEKQKEEIVKILDRIQNETSPKMLPESTNVVEPKKKRGRISKKELEQQMQKAIEIEDYEKAQEIKIKLQKYK